MPYKITYNENVDIEVAKAFHWYNNQRLGLGEDFLDNYFSTLETLRESPLIFQIYRANYHKCQVNKFPYAIYYQVTDDTVLILGVFHAARNPRNIFKHLQQR